MAIDREPPRVSVESGLTFYDTAFLALGRLLECPVVTADRKVVRRARPEGAALPLAERPWSGRDPAR